IAADRSDTWALWSRDGSDCPIIHIDVDDCSAAPGAATFRLRIPDDFFARCPGARSSVMEFQRVLAAERPVGAGRGETAIDAATIVLGIAWLGFFALAVASRGFGAFDGTSKAAMAALFCASLVLRWMLASGGPGDLHLNLAGISSRSFELRWGPAPI